MSAPDGTCPKCGKPRDNEEYKLCDGCREKNRVAVARFHGRDPAAAKTCATEGCNAIVEYRRTFCAECAKARKTARNRARGKTPEYEDIKPHRPEAPPPRMPLLSEEEQQRLDAEASARDRAWHAKFMKENLGLESPAPGKPLASKVVTPPKEVWEEYQKSWTPQRECQPREYWIPSRGDVSY